MRSLGLRSALVGALLCFVVASEVHAQPAVVSVTGSLTDSFGNVVDGEVVVTFSLYSDLAGTNLLFTETFSPLRVDDGTFIAPLGSSAALPLAIFDDGASIYLGMRVDGDSTDMLPRVPFTTVGYAGYARSAGSVAWDDVVGVPSDLDDGDDDTTYTANAPLILTPGATPRFGLSNVGCDPGDAWVWTAAGWRCETAAAAELDAGLGIAITGTTIGIDAVACGPTQFARWTATGWSCANDNVGITALGAGPGITTSGANIAIDAPVCDPGEYSVWTATGWTCAADGTAGLSVGDGLVLDGSTNTLSTDATVCDLNEYSFWDGDSWECADDQRGLTSVLQGNGIQVTGGNRVAIQAPNCAATGYSYWDGDSWECGADQTGITSVLPGTGITVAANGRTVSINSVACNSTSYSRWTASGWACVTDNAGVTQVTGGTGVVVGTSGSSREVSLDIATCAAGNFQRWNGTSWSCEDDREGITGVVAGNGISVASSGNNRTISIAAANCSSGVQYSYWNGSSWQCRTDDAGVEEVRAGYGLDVSGGTSAIATMTLDPAEVLELVPVGSIIAWDKSGATGLTLNANWVECNGQTINSPGSPFHNRTAPDLNRSYTDESGTSQEGRFLRGGNTSRVYQTDTVNRFHQLEQDYDNKGCERCTTTLPANGTWTGWINQYYSNDAIRLRTNGEETRPMNMSVVWVMRIR